MHRVFFHTFLSTLAISYSFDNFKRYVDDKSSFWWLVILSIFLCTCWSFVCLVWKNVCSDPLTIFKVRFFVVVAVRVVWVLYTLWLLIPYWIWIANMFSHSNVAFYFVDNFLHCAQGFLFDIVSLFGVRAKCMYV